MKLTKFTPIALGLIFSSFMMSCSKEDPNNPDNQSGPTTVKTETEVLIGNSNEKAEVAVNEKTNSFEFEVISGTDTLYLITDSKEPGLYTVGKAKTASGSVAVSYFSSNGSSFEVTGGMFELISVSPTVEAIFNFDLKVGSETITVAGSINETSNEITALGWVKVDGKKIYDIYGATKKSYDHELDQSGRFNALFLSDYSMDKVEQLWNDSLELEALPFNVTSFTIVTSISAIDNIEGDYTNNSTWADGFDANTAPDYSIQFVTITNNAEGKGYNHDHYLTDHPVTTFDITNTNGVYEINAEFDVTEVDFGSLAEIKNKKLELYFKGNFSAWNLP